MLLAVDLHFQVDLAGAHIGRLYAEDEGVVVFLLLDDGFAQPGEDFAQMVYRLFDGFGAAFTWTRSMSSEYRGCGSR